MYFHSSGVEHIPQEIRRFVDNKNIITNISRIQYYDSIICGYFCIVFIGFMFSSKILADFANLFSPHYFKKDDKVMRLFFEINYKHE